MIFFVNSVDIFIIYILEPISKKEDLTCQQPRKPETLHEEVT